MGTSISRECQAIATNDGPLRMVLTIGVAVADTAHVGGANQRFGRECPGYSGRKRGQPALHPREV